MEKFLRQIIITTVRNAAQCSLVVEHLPSMGKTLGLIPSTEIQDKERKREERERKEAEAGAHPNILVLGMS